MKPLKVRYWKARQIWVIDGRRIGLYKDYGKFTTEAEACKAADELQAKHTLNLLEKPTDKTITGAFVATEFDQYQKNRLDVLQEIGADSYKNCKRVIDSRVLNIKIDGKRLADIDMKAVFVADNNAPLLQAIKIGVVSSSHSEQTCRAWWNHAKHFFSYALKRGYISVNPLTREKFTYKGREVEDKIAPMVQANTVRSILQHGLEGETIRNQAIAWLQAETGIRQGEARALRVCDIDRQRQVIRISGAIKSGSLERGDPKTKYGVREVPYGAGFAKLLPELLISLKYCDAESYVFQTNSGQPMSRKTLQALMQRMKRRSGVAEFNWKALRHAFATMQLNGLARDAHGVAKLMGHHNSSFTEAQYGHTFRDDAKLEQARDVMADYLGK
jgi:integrase